jgi:hypothetical protein
LDMLEIIDESEERLITLRGWDTLSGLHTGRCLHRHSSTLMMRGDEILTNTKRFAV